MLDTLWAQATGLDSLLVHQMLVLTTINFLGKIRRIQNKAHVNQPTGRIASAFINHSQRLGHKPGRKLKLSSEAIRKLDGNFNRCQVKCARISRAAK